MANDDPTLAIVRAKLDALHRAAATPVTECAWVNALAREYPEAARRHIMGPMLAAHKAGEAGHIDICRDFVAWDGQRAARERALH